MAFADTLVPSAGSPHKRHHQLEASPRSAGCNLAGGCGRCENCEKLWAGVNRCMEGIVAQVSPTRGLAAQRRLQPGRWVWEVWTIGACVGRRQQVCSNVASQESAWQVALRLNQRATTSSLHRPLLTILHPGFALVEKVLGTLHLWHVRRAIASRPAS